MNRPRRGDDHAALSYEITIESAGVSPTLGFDPLPE